MNEDFLIGHKAIAKEFPFGIDLYRKKVPILKEAGVIMGPRLFGRPPNRIYRVWSKKSIIDRFLIVNPHFWWIFTQCLNIFSLNTQFRTILFQAPWQTLKSVISLRQMADEPNNLRQKMLDSLNSPIIKCLDSKGITLDKLADKLIEELDATNVKQFQYEGHVVEADPLIAWDIRQKARQDAHKLRGDYPAEKKHISLEGSIQSIPLDEEGQAKLEAAKELIRERAKKVE